MTRAVGDRYRRCLSPNALSGTDPLKGSVPTSHQRLPIRAAASAPGAPRSIASVATAGAVKTVTVLFCDVTGSTALGERLDPESLRRVLARYFETAKIVVERHGGTVEKFIGDAVMAVFGPPAARSPSTSRRATRPPPGLSLIHI